MLLKRLMKLYTSCRSDLSAQVRCHTIAVSKVDEIDNGSEEMVSRKQYWKAPCIVESTIDVGSLLIYAANNCR